MMTRKKRLALALAVVRVAVGSTVSHGKAIERAHGTNTVLRHLPFTPRLNRSLVVIAFTLVMGSGLAHAQGTAPADEGPPATKEQWVAMNPADFHWKVKDTLPQKPSPAQAAVVWGDPLKGAYAFFGKFPAGFTVPMHWHTNEVLVVMTKNSMVITPEAGTPQEITEGGFFSLPAKMKYIAHCAQECVFLAWGDKPFDIFYQDPKDDPRKFQAHAREQYEFGP